METAFSQVKDYEQRDISVDLKVAGWKRAGALVGVVPTMGALHDGQFTRTRRWAKTPNMVELSRKFSISMSKSRVIAPAASLV